MRALALIVFSLLLSLVAAQTTTTYLYIGGNIGWAAGYEYPPYEVTPGMILVFEWNGQHNVNMLPNKAAYDACDFSQATVLATTNQGRGNTQWTNIYLYNITTTPVFFSCSLPGHCAGGMKFAAITPGTMGLYNGSTTPTSPATPTTPTLGGPTLPGGGPTLPGGGPTLPGGATTPSPTTPAPTTPTPTNAPTTPTPTPTSSATQGPTTPTPTPTSQTTASPTTPTTSAPTNHNTQSTTSPPPNHAYVNHVPASWLVGIIMLVLGSWN